MRVETSVFDRTLSAALDCMATLDFDRHKQGGALTGGGVEGDTAYPVMTFADDIDTSAFIMVSCTRPSASA